MWKNKTISVAIPAYNEEETVGLIVRQFKDLGYIDEIVLVDNNSRDKTAERARAAGARVVREERQGYGFALQRGLREASGDLIVLSEADGNFDAKDTLKLLAYADDFDFVKGTRTRKELYEPGVMPPFMSFCINVGNVFVAKMVQFLWRGPVFTDAGCTMRLIKKEALGRILPYLTVGQAHFLAQMMTLATMAKIKTIEVPVHFKRRLGGYSKSGNFGGLLKIAVMMTGLILKYRLVSLLPNNDFQFSQEPTKGATNLSA